MVLNIDGVRNGEKVAGFSLKPHLDVLARTLHDNPDIKLVTIDPLSACLEGVDTHKNADVRGVLKPLSDMAKRHGVAVVAIEHLNKNSQGSKMIHRIQGSVGLVGAARTAWGLVSDPSDPEYRILQVIKNNLAPSTGATGLRFRIDDDGELDWDQKPVSHTLDELNLAAPGRDASGEAIEWLETQLREPVAANDVYSRAKQAGISRRTIQRAKSELGVRSQSVERTSYWLPVGVNKLTDWSAKNPDWKPQGDHE